MGICLGDKDHDCLTNMRFVLLFASSKRAAPENDVRLLNAAQKKWVSKYIRQRRKFSATKVRTVEKDMVIDNIKVEILTRNESTKYLGQMITFLHQETAEIKNRIRAAWATFNKYKQELTSRSYLLRHRLRLFDAAVTPNDELHFRNMGPHKRPRKNDTIDATQNAKSHFSDENKNTKKPKQKGRTSD